MTPFAEYVAHGWILVPIQPGHKGPSGSAAKGWNQKALCVTDAPSAEKLPGAGLAHAYSGTCAIDVDHYETAQKWLADRGVDLDALFLAPDSVQIVSGRAGRGKLLYTIPQPLPSKKVAYFEKNRAALDFRCATNAGLTVQDVLPPSLHPDTGKPYKWAYGDDLIGHWSAVPPIPDALLELWKAELTESGPTLDPGTIDSSATADELRELLRNFDPSANRDDWIKVGMAVHSASDGSQEGLLVWDEWSAQSDKYQGINDLATCWRSFSKTPNGITVGYLRQGAIATADDFEDVSGENSSNAATFDPWAAATAQRKQRFSFKHISDVTKEPAPKWIVKGFLPKASIAMIYGPSGAGKSFVALDLAFAIARGIQWDDRVVEQGSVAWIAAEAYGSMRNRALGYAIARAVNLKDVPLDVMGKTVSLMHADDSAALIDAVVEKNPAVIVIDTLAAVSGGGNENSGEDMNVILSHCRTMHERTGATVILIHHSGKDASKGARGWSGIRAAVDTEVEITDANGGRIMSIKKQRDGRIGERRIVKLIPVAVDMENETCYVELAPAENTAGMGKNDRLTLKAFIMAARQTGSVVVDYNEVLDLFLAIVPAPKDGARDYRKKRFQESIANLNARMFLGPGVDPDTITVLCGLDGVETGDG